MAQSRDEADAAAALRAVKAAETRARRAAEKKVAKAVAKREQQRAKREEAKLAEAESDRLLAAHLDGVKSDPTDPYVYLDLAAAATKIGAAKRAEAAYADAIALGIPNPKASGLAKRDYAELLWSRKKPAYFSVFRYTGQGALRREIGGKSTSGVPTLESLSKSYFIREMKRGDLDKEVPDVVHYLREADADLRRHLRSAPDDVEALDVVPTKVVNR